MRFMNKNVKSGSDSITGIKVYLRKIEHNVQTLKFSKKLIHVDDYAEKLSCCHFLTDHLTFNL